MKKYKVGITFNLEAENTDIWSNGANQNVIFLYQLLRNSKIIEDVYLVSWGPNKTVTPPEGFMLDGLDLKFVYFDDIYLDLDLIIEGTLAIEQSKARQIRENNGKLVCYKMGNEFIMDMESFVFNKPVQSTFNGTFFDAIWMIPQHQHTCNSFFSILYRCPTYTVPDIWAPTFCDKVINEIKEHFNLDFGYKPNSKKAKSISSFEPNVNVVKSCFVPILLVEQAYRLNSNVIEHYYVCNTYDKRENPTFVNFIGYMNVVKDGILSVEGRYRMPYFLSKFTDIVISHQWENGLNYSYNDALYGGYPFIHNSRLLPKGVGYYYSEFDAFDGAKVLLDVIENHDNNHNEYVKRANEYLETLLPTNSLNICKYEIEIRRLFSDV